jgi:quercetin dioxygenase-like cupin family protein
MQIVRAAESVARRGEGSYFTGAVWLNAMRSSTPELSDVQNINVSNVNAFLVFFESGARTAWHKHPAGQILYVVAGNGRVGSVDAPEKQRHQDEIHQGDVIYFAPGEKHWHGAGPNSSLTHVAINLGTADTQTEWLEKVTDEEYGA